MRVEIDPYVLNDDDSRVYSRSILSMRGLYIRGSNNRVSHVWTRNWVYNGIKKMLHVALLIVHVFINSRIVHHSCPFRISKHRLAAFDRNLHRAATLSSMHCLVVLPVQL